MAAYKFKTLDDILRYAPPKTTPFKGIRHASQKGFGARIMRPSKRDGTVLRTYLVRFSGEKGEDVKRNIYPVPGLEWIGSGYGDFSLGRTLVEVKCTAKRFSAADYRQVAIYWILSYAAAVESRGEEWQDFILLNSRSGQMVTMKFDTFLSVLSSGRTKVDILQLFQSLVGSRLMR